MVKVKLVRAAAVAATSVGLMAAVGGIAGASAGTVKNTGPWSTNKIVSVAKNHAHVTNNNSLGLSSLNSQSAYSGHTEVEHNTTGGSAMSGNANNSNSLNASVSITNSSSLPVSLPGASNNSATIDTTGPNSENKVVDVTKNSLHVTNNNEVTLETSNSQQAASGSAEVEGNTTGGNAVSGSASNTSSSSFNVTIHN